MTALVNAARRELRLARLVPSTTLITPARGRSIAMARGGAFIHSSAFPWAQGRAVAQNIARAPTAAAAFEAMMASAPHRRNLLGRPYRVVGVGAARACSGEIFFTVNLMSGPPPD